MHFWDTHNSVNLKAISSKPERWFQTQHASVLFIENPMGTGLSYCETDTDDCYTTSTGQIAEDLLELLKVVFMENPEFQVCINTVHAFYSGISLYKNMFLFQWPLSWTNIAAQFSIVVLFFSALSYATPFPYCYLVRHGWYSLNIAVTDSDASEYTLHYLSDSLSHIWALYTDFGPCLSTA